MFNNIPLSQLREIDARRICLIKPTALGDIVQTLPLLTAICERFPRARVAWVASIDFAPLLEPDERLDEVILYRRRGNWRDWRTLLGTLGKRRFDLVFDMQGLLRSGLMTAATRAPIRVGLETAREGAHLACNYAIPDTGREVPAHLRYWRVAEAIGMGELHREPRIHVTEAANHWAQAKLSALRPPVLAVHAGAGWKTKRWPVEKFAVIAAKAARRYGFSTVILGSNGERAAARQIELLLKRFVPASGRLNLAGATTLPQLAGVLSNTDILLSNDSGPMHLAAGLGTPVVGLFTCTSPIRSGPPGKQHALVTTALSCAGSYKKRCPYRGRKHLACFEELSAERAWHAFESIVEKTVAEPAVA